MTTRLVALLVALMAAGWPQNAPQKPTLRIVDPESGTPVVNEIVIRVAIEPASQPVQRITFFVDGNVVCRVERPQPPYQCAWNAGSKLGDHRLHVVADLPGAPSVSADVRTEGGVSIPYNVDAKQVTVTVLDGNRFVRGLKAPAFHLWEDDVLQKTTLVTAEESTLEVVVGVDISESMTNAIEGVKKNVARFLAALRPADKATVLPFNERYYVAATPDVERASQIDAVNTLAPWGMTSLYELLVGSYDHLITRQGRRALVIFSDGNDTSSRVPREAVEKRAERNDAVLFVIGQGEVLQRADLRDLCERLATKSGGRAFFPLDAQALSAAFDAIIEELSNQYMLSYQPPSNVPGRHHRWRVQVDGGYTVKAPSGYTLPPRK